MVTCLACGKDVEPGDYCSNCGTGLDEESQQAAADEHSATSKQLHLAASVDALVPFTKAPSERDALARIKHRIETAPLERFMDDGEEVTADAR